MNVDSSGRCDMFCIVLMISQLPVQKFQTVDRTMLQNHHLASLWAQCRCMLDCIKLDDSANPGWMGDVSFGSCPSFRIIKSLRISCFSDHPESSHLQFCTSVYIKGYANVLEIDDSSLRRICTLADIMVCHSEMLITELHAARTDSDHGYFSDERVSRKNSFGVRYPLGSASYFLSSKMCWSIESIIWRLPITKPPDCVAYSNMTWQIHFAQTWRSASLLNNTMDNLIIWRPAKPQASGHSSSKTNIRGSMQQCKYSLQLALFQEVMHQCWIDVNQ